jgi:hypothetical protein
MSATTRSWVRVLLLAITTCSSVADKIRNFFSTYVSHDKDLDRDFANIALNDDDDDDHDGSRTKGLKYMQQLVCFSYSRISPHFDAWYSSNK